MNPRPGWIQEILRSEHATGILITHLPHIRWACGFSGSSGVLLIKEDGSHFLTDRRYEVQAKLEVHTAATIHIASESLINLATRTELVQSGDRLVIQPEYLTLAELQRWESLIDGVCLIPVKNLLQAHVAQKSEKELTGMRRAQKISDSVFHDICQKITPGMREHELAAMIDYHHRMQGASGMAFDTIVAFGANAALPHARPGSRQLCKNEALLLDFGCIVDGFHSDMTRTLFHGVPGEEFRTAYRAVQRAQTAAIKTTAAGVRASEVDQAARSSLASDGLDTFFTHSTGHGIGWEVHEWPRIAETSSELLHEGYTITIEPGVYLSRKFGIRIEDTVVVKSSGCEQLSSVSRDLITL